MSGTGWSPAVCSPITRLSPGSGRGTRRRWAGCSARCCGCWRPRAWCRWACSAWMAPSWPATPRRRRTRRCRRPGKLLAEAAERDAADDAREGSDPPAATPRALARRAERRERLAAARDRLAAEDNARRQAQYARQQAWDAAAAAGQRRGGRRPGDEPRTNRNNTEPRANITDPDVRVMRNQKGYLAGYNGQLVVTGGQVIVGAMLSQHPVDRTLLHPLPGTCRQQLTEAGIKPRLRTVLADAGYVSEETFARADSDGLRLLAPLAKDPGRHRARTPQKALHLDRLPATARARRRMQHPRGRDDYKMRSRTVEPVFGQLKTCQNFTMMSRRGFTACESEWLLASTAHNLRKLHRHRAAG